MKVDYVEYAKDVILKILNNNDEPTAASLYEIFEINSGNNKILLEHFIAIRNIMNNAIEELETSKKYNIEIDED